MKYLGITAIAILSFIGGYCIGTSALEERTNQRDRLADYIHQYMDNQYAGLDNTLEECINDWQHEDSLCNDLGFFMSVDDWYFAY